MRSLGRFAVLLVAIALLILGCTKTPPIPELPRRQPLPLEQILISERITPKDIRQIFSILNRNGKFEAFRALIEDLSDEEMQNVAAFITKYLYWEGDQKWGILGILEERIQRKTFSQIAQWVRNWAGSDHHTEQVAALFGLLDNDNFPSLVEHDIGLLDPDWSQLAFQFAQKAKGFKERKNWRPEPLPSVDAIFSDIKKVLSSDALRKDLPLLTADLLQYDFGSNLLRALYEFKGNGEWTEAAEGFGYGLRELCPSEKNKENQIEKLLLFARTADEVSRDLFTVLNENKNLLVGLSNALRPAIARGYAGVIRDTLIGQEKLDKAFWKTLVGSPSNNFPSESFKTLMEKVTAAITEKITGPITTDDGAYGVLLNMPIYLNAYVLTRWLETTLSDPENQMVVQNALSEKGSMEILWNSVLKIKPLTIELVKKNGSKYEFPHSAFLTALGLDANLKFVSAFQTYVETKEKKPEGFTYRFVPSQKELSLRTVFAETVSTADKLLRLGASTSNSFVWINDVILPPVERELREKDWKELNLMDLANRILAIPTVENFRAVKRILFEDMKIGHLSKEEKKNILLIASARPELEEPLKTLLDTLQVLYDFDKTPQGLPSPYELYHQLLTNTRGDDLHSVTKLLSFLSRSEFFSTDKNQKPLYPAFIQIAKNGRLLSQWVYGLSSIGKKDRSVLLGPILDTMDLGPDGSSGTERHLEALDYLLTNHYVGLQSLWKFITKDGWENLLLAGGILPSERYWWMNLVKAGDHRTLLKLKARFTRASLLRIAVDLNTLYDRGTLEEAFDYLALIRNDRIQKVAKVFKYWATTRELKQLLLALEAALH